MSLTFDAANHPSFLLAGADLVEAELCNDAAIEDAVRGMLDDLPNCELTHIDVTSCGGVVRLDGTVTDGRWLARFKNRVTAAMPSVSIDDRLDWIVPDCGIGYA